MRRARAIALTLAVVATGLSIDEPAQGSGRPPCPEYVPGRVVAGEYQRLTCDVSPPQALDLQMSRRGNPRARCDDRGGHYYVRKNKCNGVDY